MELVKVLQIQHLLQIQMDPQEQFLEVEMKLLLPPFLQAILRPLITQQV